jgi:hypothetical protein
MSTSLDPAIFYPKGWIPVRGAGQVYKKHLDGLLLMVEN